MSSIRVNGAAVKVRCRLGSISRLGQIAPCRRSGGVFHVGGVHMHEVLPPFGQRLLTVIDFMSSPQAQTVDNRALLMLYSLPSNLYPVQLLRFFPDARSSGKAIPYHVVKMICSCKSQIIFEYLLSAVKVISYSTGKRRRHPITVVFNHMWRKDGKVHEYKA